MTVAVVDNYGQVEAGIQMIMCQTAVVDAGILDNEGNMSWVNDKPYYNKGEGEEDDEAEKGEGSTSEELRVAAAWQRLRFGRG